MTRWLIDTYVVWSIHFQGFIRDWPFFLLISLISGGTFFMLRLVTNAPPELETRLLAGAMVFGVGMQSINMTGQLMVSERFQGQMKLFKIWDMACYTANRHRNFVALAIYVDTKPITVWNLIRQIKSSHPVKFF